MKTSVTRTGDTLTLTVWENGEVYVFEFDTEAELRSHCDRLGIPVPSL